MKCNHKRGMSLLACNIKTFNNNGNMETETWSLRI